MRQDMREWTNYTRESLIARIGELENRLEIAEKRASELQARLAECMSGSFRLMAERDQAEEQVEVFRQDRARDEAHIEDLEIRNGRLRKSVNWLRGALHDDHVPRGADGLPLYTADECTVWECQRVRDILIEDRRENAE